MRITEVVALSTELVGSGKLTILELPTSNPMLVYSIVVNGVYPQEDVNRMRSINIAKTAG